MTTPRDAGSSRRFWGADAIVAVAWIAAIAVIIHFLDRGFDIADEGLYLLSARYPGDAWISASDYHLYLGAIYTAVGGTVIGLRVAGVLLLTTTAAFAGIAFEGAARDALGNSGRLLGRRTMPVFCALGALLYYTWLPPTPSYNLLSSAAAYAVLGFLLLALRPKPARAFSRRNEALAFCAGICVSVALFTKLPAGVALAALVPVTIAVQRRRWSTAEWRLAGIVGLGFIGWTGFHFALFGGPFGWWRRLSGGYRLLQIADTGHSITAALEMFAHEIARLRVAGIAATLVAGAVLVAAGFALRAFDGDRTTRGRPLVDAAIYSSLALIAWRVVRLQWYRGGSASVAVYFAPYLVLSVWLIAVYATLSVHRASPRRAGWLPDGALLVLLAGAFMLAPIAGTNNRPDLGAILSMAPWFAACWLALELLVRRGLSPWCARIVLACVSCIAAAQVIASRHGTPRGGAAPIVAQTDRVTLSSAHDALRIDSASAAQLLRLRGILADCGFRPGGDLLPLVRIPGLVYAVDGRSPASPWYAEGLAGASQYNESLLRMIGRDRVRRAFLLWTPDASASLPDLATVGLSLDRDFTECGAIVWPASGAAIQVWRAAAR